MFFSDQRTSRRAIAILRDSRAAKKSYITATNKKSLRATGFDRTRGSARVREYEWRAQGEKFHDRSVKLARAGTFHAETSIIARAILHSRAQ